MIKIKLKTPSKVSFDANKGLNCKISNQFYVEESSDVKLPFKFSVFVNLTEKGEDGRFIMPIDGTKTFKKETAHQISEVNKVVGKNVQIAELLFDKLKSINDGLKSNADLSPIFAKFDNEHMNYPKLDFMAHRNLLSEVIKSKKVDQINKISKEYHIKSVRSALNDFILESNKYSHGELLLKYPEEKTLLEFKNSKGEFEYAELTKDSLNSYSKAYELLDKYLTKISA